MRKLLSVLTVLSLSAVVASAGPKPQSGTVLSQSSVACGEKKSKKQSLHILCQEYLVRSGATDYTIRQPKPSEQELIPLNTAIQFTLDKNKMKFKANGKSFEFTVISQAAASAGGDKPASAPNPQ